MHFLTLATLLVAGSATVFANPLEQRTNQKANEYSTPDCSGPINYSHARPSLGNVNMDPSSHSVYLAGATWRAWTEQNEDGNGQGSCSGINMGTISNECQNLDTTLPEGRIACLTPF